MSERRYPVMDGPSIPWHVIEPHESQAQENHGQTLRGLARRGGLSACEAHAVLEDRKYPRGGDVTEHRKAGIAFLNAINDRTCPTCAELANDKQSLAGRNEKLRGELAEKDREIDSLVIEVNKANARSAEVGRCIDCSVIGQGLCSRHSTCPTCAEKDREIERWQAIARSEHGALADRVNDLECAAEVNAKELEAARGLKKGDYACHLIGCTGATIRSCTCGLMALMEAIKDE